MLGNSFDWSKPPYVDPHDAEDFAAMAGDDEYEGASVATAKKIFEQHGLGWDGVTPEQFKRLIDEIKTASAKSAAKIASACFVFCDKIIDSSHRKKWVIAVMAAADRHEEED